MSSGKRDEDFVEEAGKTMNLPLRLTACLNEILDPPAETIEVYKPTGYLAKERGDLFPTVTFI